MSASTTSSPTSGVRGRSVTETTGAAPRPRRRRPPTRHVVGGVVHLGRAWPIATPRPAQREHLDVVAPVADREHVGPVDAEVRGDVLAGRTALQTPDGGEVEPRGPADDVVGAVQAQRRGHRARSRPPRQWGRG